MKGFTGTNGMEKIVMPTVLAMYSVGVVQNDSGVLCLVLLQHL